MLLFNQMILPVRRLVGCGHILWQSGANPHPDPPPEYRGRGKGRTAATKYGHARLVRSILFASLGVVALAGCAADNSAWIDRSVSALDANQPRQAIANARNYLDAHPNGPGAAEAWYLVGRGDEMIPGNLGAAHDAYARALALNPSRQQQAYIRAGLANVAFFDDDFATALEQWTIAYSGLTDHTTRAWTLYRMGLCQQRLGRFDQADGTFALVQQQYADTPAAARAADKSGYRDFWVQIGVFNNQLDAWGGLSFLHRTGYPAQLFHNKQGQHVLCAGPEASYAEASQLRARLVKRYPGAMIVP
jgi:TolA-binding protein